MEFGPGYQLSWGNYRGDRFGIYNFNTKQDDGYVDVDFLEYEFHGGNAGAPTLSSGTPTPK
jgi:hypothetical protein